MEDKRFTKLKTWLTDYFDNNQYKLSIASDDASFRRYLRVKKDNKSFIIMDAPIGKEDPSKFVKIAEYLYKNNIKVPKVYAQDLKNGFLILDDFNDTTLLSSLKEKYDINYYIDAIDNLIAIQKLPCKNNIPPYSKKLLMQEMQLFIDWYLAKNLKTKLNNSQQKKINNLFLYLTDNALKQKQVFVHKDYHSRNLMLLKNNNLGILDFQDAVIGPVSYDLVSLLKDAYFKINKTDLIYLLKYYYNNSDLNIDYDDFIKQFDLMGLQRFIKILGIFSRLYFRDGKEQYLADIPLVKHYISAVIDKYQQTYILKDFI